MPDSAPLRTTTVAIAGGSGSGKTTLALAIRDRLAGRCAVLDHDSYYRDQGHLPPDVRARVNYDDPASLENDLLAAQLRQLRRGAPIDKPRYCFSTHTRLDGTDRIAPSELVVVEGILVLTEPQLHSAFDLRVFVDAPDDVRALRRVQRDVAERGRTLESVVTQWSATVQPMFLRHVAPVRARADLVVSGTEPVETTVERVLAAVGVPA